MISRTLQKQRCYDPMRQKGSLKAVAELAEWTGHKHTMQESRRNLELYERGHKKDKQSETRVQPLV